MKDYYYCVDIYKTKMSIQDTITIIKEQITDGEIERCIMAHKAGISPQLIAVDSDANALTFERCTPITDMSQYYYEIYDLLLKGITYSRHLAHCDPGPKCTSEKGCNLMLLNGVPVLIDWGETCSGVASNNSPEVTALDVFMRYWFKPATQYKITNEKKILQKIQDLKTYILEKYSFNIEEDTKYEIQLKEKIELKQKEQEEQDARMKAKLARLSKKKGGSKRTKKTRKKTR